MSRVLASQRNTTHLWKCQCVNTLKGYTSSVICMLADADKHMICTGRDSYAPTKCTEAHNPPPYQQKTGDTHTPSVNDLLSNHYFWISSTNGVFMDLPDTQMTFVCIISARKEKKCLKKRGQSWKKDNKEKNKSKRGQALKNFLRDETIKMLFSPRGTWTTGQSVFGLHTVYTPFSNSVFPPFLHPELYLIAPISVKRVNPCC